MNVNEFPIVLFTTETGEIRVAAMWFLLGWLRQGFRPEESYACIYACIALSVNVR